MMAPQKNTGKFHYYQFPIDFPNKKIAMGGPPDLQTLGQCYPETAGEPGQQPFPEVSWAPVGHAPESGKSGNVRNISLK